MDATTEVAAYEKTLTIGASPETVWEFLVDPQKLMRWKGIDAELEPRPGGIYRCVVLPGHTALGEFVEVDKPHRLVWTWGWEGQDSHGVPPGSSKIHSSPSLPPANVVQARVAGSSTFTLPL